MSPNYCSLVVFAASLAIACAPTPPPDAGRDVLDEAATPDVITDAATNVVTDADASADASTDAGTNTDARADVEFARGCPVLSAPQGRAGEAPMGDTFAEFVGPLLVRVCTRCHSTASTMTDMRRGAPAGLDWDQEATVRMHLPLIRSVVGVLNNMPFNPPPDLTCEERRRIVRWIDIGAP